MKLPHFRRVAIGLALLPLSAQAAVILEGFESGIPSGPQGPPGISFTLPSGDWFAINETIPIGSLGVFQGNLTVFGPHQGAGYAGINFNSGSGAANLNTWLISPEMVINNGDTVSFFTRETTGNTFPDRLRLRLSTNGSSVLTGDFSTIMLTVNPALNTVDYPENWTEFTATVTGLGGPVSGRFAFQYDVTNGGPSGANSNYIGIDTVTFTLGDTALVPEPSSVVLPAMACLLLSLRRSRKD